jgi:hypothetical protein
MRLKPIQLRCRAAVRWPADASLGPAAHGTTKSWQSHRDLAKQRRDRVLSIVFDPTNAPAVWASRPPSSMIFGLRGDDRLLSTSQQLLRLGQGQTEIGDIADTVRPADLHHVGAPRLAVSTQLHQPHDPDHPPIPSQSTDAEDAPPAPPPPVLRRSRRRRLRPGRAPGRGAGPGHDHRALRW